MKVNITKAGTYSITGLTRTDYRTIGYILRIANDRYFGEQDEDGNYLRYYPFIFR